MVWAAFPAGTRAMARPNAARLNYAGRFPESGVPAMRARIERQRAISGVTVDRGTKADALVGYPNVQSESLFDDIKKGRAAGY